jgi:FAD synthetase
MTAGDSKARDVEVPASPLVSNAPLPFPDLCARINDRIEAFLREEPASERLRSLQDQTRASLDVIGEALEDYKYGPPPARVARGS